MTRLSNLFLSDKKRLSIYFTAGFPNLEDTVPILTALENSGVDFVEIGLPFSDPLADGPVIQNSSTVAIRNGMTAKLLFGQLSGIRESVKMPIVLMGYFNTLLQFGMDDFLKACKNVGIDALIIPDLPLQIFVNDYKTLFESYGIAMVFLITPQTPAERIREIDAVSNGFLYLVASAAITGNSKDFGPEQEAYFERIASMKLKNPIVAGFGIHDKATFELATRHTSGAIVGSAFIRYIEKNGLESLSDFIQEIH